MPRKPKPRQLEAGEVVSFFEEMPVEHAALVLSIVTASVAKRKAQAEQSFAEPVVVKRRKNPGLLEPPTESLREA